MSWSARFRWLLLLAPLPAGVGFECGGAEGFQASEQVAQPPVVADPGLVVLALAGFQKSATVVDLGFLRGPLILVEEAAKHRSALDLHLGEVSDRVIGCGRVELAAAMRSSAVVVGFVLGYDPVPLENRIR
jgi:hypothetical protein